MKKRRFPLILGGIIIVLLILIMVFPRLFTKVNPYLMENMKSIGKGNENLTMQGAPFKPSKEFLLGSDSIGRDIFSMIIYGTRLTLSLGILTVFFRFFLAVPLGILAGFGHKIAGAVIKEFNLIFSAIPSLIFSILVLKIGFFMGLYKTNSIIAFVIVLTFVGWGRLAALIQERVEDIVRKPFVIGETAIGKSKFKIAVENVMPHLFAELIVLFFMEMALALAIIMELGIFGVYVGNLRVIENTDGGTIKAMDISFEPEWASMLSTSRTLIYTAPYTVIPPAFMFFLSILGFNMFGEGLRDMLQQKDSKFVIHIRRAFSKKNFQKLLAGTVAVILIVVGIVKFPGRYKLDASSISQGINFKNQVVIGSDEAKYTASQLENSLKNLQIEPLGKDYITSFSAGKLYTMDSGSLNYDGKNLKEGTDYSYLSFGSYEKTGQVVNLSSEDLISSNDEGKYKNKFIMLDSNFYSDEAITNLTKTIKSLGIIKILNKSRVITSTPSTSFDNDTALIAVSEEAARKIDKKEIKLSLKSKLENGNGQNVMGVIKGSDPKESKQAIILSLGYNYLQSDNEAGKERILMLLNMAKEIKQAKISRTVIIAFFDGNAVQADSGIYEYVKNTIYKPEDTVLNIDFTDYKLSNSKILYGNQQLSVAKYFAFSFDHMLAEDMKKMKINYESFLNERTVEEIVREGPRPFEALYYVKAIPTIMISSSGSQDEIYSAVLKTLMDNKY